MVICCIGTPRIKGDSLAPKVGDNLVHHNINAFVYGTSDYPITALNYMTFYNHIATCHKNDFVIAVDCALGNKTEIGSVKITKKGITPGKAIGRDLATIGNIGILGQVGDIKRKPFDELKNTPDSVVNSLVDKITSLIISLSDAITINKNQSNLKKHIDFWWVFEKKSPIYIFRWLLIYHFSICNFYYFFTLSVKLCTSKQSLNFLYVL